jgi:hypothetical protein
LEAERKVVATFRFPEAFAGLSETAIASLAALAAAVADAGSTGAASTLAGSSDARADARLRVFDLDVLDRFRSETLGACPAAAVAVTEAIAEADAVTEEGDATEVGAATGIGGAVRESGFSVSRLLAERVACRDKRLRCCSSAIWAANSGAFGCAGETVYGEGYVSAL